MRADTHAAPSSLPRDLRRYHERDRAAAAAARRHGERLGRPFEWKLQADADAEPVLRGQLGEACQPRPIGRDVEVDDANPPLLGGWTPGDGAEAASVTHRGQCG